MNDRANASRIEVRPLELTCWIVREYANETRSSGVGLCRRNRRHKRFIRGANSCWASSMITVVKQILGHHVRLGGQSHSGWLPAGATTPLPTATTDVAFNITIEFAGSGYVLCYASEDGALANDTLHQTLEDAEQAAAENFGVRADQ